MFKKGLIYSHSVLNDDLIRFTLHQPYWLLLKNKNICYASLGDNKIAESPKRAGLTPALKLKKYTYMRLNNFFMLLCKDACIIYIFKAFFWDLFGGKKEKFPHPPLLLH